MGLLERIQENQKNKAERRNIKLRILQRMPIKDLAKMYDDYVDMGDQKAKYIEPGSIADFATSLIGGTDSRQKLIAKLADNLTLELIIQSAKKAGVEINDIPQAQP